MDTGLKKLLLKIRVLCISICLALSCAPKIQNQKIEVQTLSPDRVNWKHLSSSQADFVPPGVGNQSALLVFDMDKDGKEEMVVAGWGTTSMVCYKMNGETWEKYLLDNRKSHIEAGGAFHDIDRDGDQDILHGGSWATNEVWWWENPFPNYNAQTPWNRYTIKDAGAKQHHDQLFGDFDHDGEVELVFWNQQAGTLVIADIPTDPKIKSSWKFDNIWSWDSKLKYEGLAKADINKDGRDDIVGGGYWFEHLGNKKFQANKIDDYGQSRSAAADIIKGGRPEVVLNSGDGVGPLNIYQWKKQRWQKTVLIDEVIHGHTLQVTDLDGDNNLDIFCAEMADWGGKNPGAKTWILYGNGKGQFIKTLLTGATGIGNHESRLGDVNGDGRPDIIQKPFQKDVPRLDIWLNNGSATSGSAK